MKKGNVFDQQLFQYMYNLPKADKRIKPNNVEGNNDKQVKETVLNNVDLDVFGMDLNWLLDCSGLIQEGGNLPQCQNVKCKACISSFNPANGDAWKCIFCGTENKFSKDIPAIQLPSTLECLGELKKKEEKKEEEKKIGIVICIDISGSMDQNFGYINAQGNIEDYQRGGSFPSVWDVLREAIIKLLYKIEKERPQFVVGLVTFSDVVTIYGDGRNHLQIPKDKPDKINKDSAHLLYDVRDLYKYVEKECKDYMQDPICKSRENLVKILNEIVNPMGATALGPALVASKQLFKPLNELSQIIVFTDGMANLGFGWIKDEDEKVVPGAEFYETTLEQLFIRHEYMLSFYAIKAQRSNEMKEEAKGKKQKVESVFGSEKWFRTVEGTGGSIRQVSPLDLIEDLDFVYNKSIASNVEIKVILPSPYFDNDYKMNTKINKLKIDKAYVFDYPRPSNELYPNFLEGFPIQVQITFEKDGKKWRRIATENVKYDVIVKKKPVIKDFKMLNQHLKQLVLQACNKDSKETAHNQLNVLLKSVLEQQPSGPKSKDIEDYKKSINEVVNENNLEKIITTTNTRG